MRGILNTMKKKYHSWVLLLGLFVLEGLSTPLRVNSTSPVLSVTILVPYGFMIISSILISYTQFFKALLCSLLLGNFALAIALFPPVSKSRNASRSISFLPIV